MHGKSFSERFRSKNGPKAAAETVARSKARVDRSAQWYVKLHFAQRAQLKALNDPIAGYLFVLLLWESFDHRGKPFELPIYELILVPGLANKMRLRTRLRKLERCGLLSVIARPPKPPLIRVPLSL
jgi:hypothetical protein